MSVAEPPHGPLDHRDATYYQVPRRRRVVLSVLAWLIVFSGGIASAAYIFRDKYLAYALSGDLNKSPEVLEAAKLLAPDLPDKPVDILIIGSDRRQDAKERRGDGRSDSIILVRLDFNQNFISLLSFPRDLYVDITGDGGFDKLNAAYSDGGGNARVIATVQRLTGEPIERFFNVDFNAFRSLVNDAGGIYLDIDRVYFNDNSGPGENFEQINIKPGYQKLRGSDALDYVRFRKDGGSDFARQVRQQAFLAELKRASRSARGVDNIVDAINRDVQTDLRSPKRLRQFLTFGLGIEQDKIFRTTITDTRLDMTASGASIVRASPETIAKAVDEWKNPVFGPAQGSNEGKPSKPSDVIVSVADGSKKLLVARRAQEAIAAKGYKAFLSSDAEGFYQRTAIFYAPGKRDDAKAIQAFFGDNASIASRRAGQPEDNDVFVVVGADYEGLITPEKVTAKPAKVKPDTIVTTQLKSAIQNIRSQTKLNFVVPTHLPRNSEIVYLRLYNIERGDRGKPDTFTVVLRVGSGRLGNRYVTITQTAMKDPPIVKTNTGVDKRGGGRTFYNGKNMQRLLWQKGNMTYWITNSLDESLTDVTIRDMRQFMVRPGKAVVPKGQKETRVPFEEKGRTP